MAKKVVGLEDAQVGQLVNVIARIESGKPVPVGRIVKIARGLSGDGKREVQNCHVKFGDGDDATTEIHEAGALVEHVVGDEAPAPKSKKSK